MKKTLLGSILLIMVAAVVVLFSRCFLDSRGTGLANPPYDQRFIGCFENSDEGICLIIYGDEEGVDGLLDGRVYMIRASGRYDRPFSGSVIDDGVATITLSSDHEFRLAIVSEDPVILQVEWITPDAERPERWPDTFAPMTENSDCSCQEEG